MTEVVVAVEEEGLVAVLMAQNIASDICSVGKQKRKKDQFPKTCFFVVKP